LTSTILVDLGLILQVASDDLVDQRQTHGRETGVEHLGRIAVNVKMNDVGEPDAVTRDVNATVIV
jgi:hypothetical protein